MEVIDIDATHNQVELTNDASDPLKPKIRFEGNPSNVYDFHHTSVQQQRHQDCDKISSYMQSIGMDTTWWNNVKAGRQNPWEKLQKLDVNGQMRQFNTSTQA